MNHDAIKTYTANSMREAMIMVREDLGPEALIVSQESIGKQTLLRATLEEFAVATTPVSKSEVVEVDLDPMDLAEDEVELSVVSEPTHTSVNNSVNALVNESVNAFELVEPELADLVYPYAAMTINQLQGKYRFIGASGVGKTSLLIKLLVEWVMVNGTQDVLVVTTNNQQLAANEALQLTCQMLGVEITNSPPGSPSSKTNAKSLVLIDTSALELQQVKPEVGIKDVLVVSALHSQSALEAQLGALAGDSSVTLGLTHVDQPFDKTSFARWLAASDIKPAFIGSSAYLPGGIQIADYPALSALLELTDA